MNLDTLYDDLKGCSRWFLHGLREDYDHFLSGKNRDKSIKIIDRILKERADEIAQQTNGVEAIDNSNNKQN